MLKKLTPADRLEMLATYIEQRDDFNMSLAHCCYYGQACRLFGEKMDDGDCGCSSCGGGHVGHLARLLDIPEGDAEMLYRGHHMLGIRTREEAAAVLRARAAGEWFSYRGPADARASIIVSAA